MRFYLMAAFFLFVSSCTIAESRKIDKGLCLKYVTYMKQTQECVGGRGVAPQICVVEHRPAVSCVRWEFPNGVPVREEKTK